MKFYIAVAIAFLATFAGISWGVRGFPMPGSGGMLTLPASASVSGKAVRQSPEAQAAKSAYDPELNRLRHVALQAAYAHSVGPCDEKNKARLIEAATDYAKAFVSATNCSLLSCSREQIAGAGAAFNTAEDHKVQSALAIAFSRGGITPADLPVGRQMAMLGFISGESTDKNVCSGGVQTRVRDRRS